MHRYPAHPPILKVLASLCYSISDTDKALKYLQGVLDASSKVDVDVDVLRMMCVIKAEIGQMQKAYDLCTQAAEILVSNKQPIPLGLLNNLCVIAANLGQSDPSKLEEVTFSKLKLFCGMDSETPTGSARYDQTRTSCP